MNERDKIARRVGPWLEREHAGLSNERWLKIWITIIGVLIMLVVVLAAGAATSAAAAKKDTHCDAQHPADCQALRQYARGLKSRIRKLDVAIEWQKGERRKDAVHVARFAILASHHLDSARQLGPGAGAVLAASYRLHTDPQPWIGQAFCESRLDPNAANGQYHGLFQMSAQWRVLVANLGAGPLDPFNQALVAIGFQLKQGSSQWSCKPTGPIRHA